MATIRTAIQLQDRFTPVIRNMSNALNMTLSSFEALQRASHNAVDTASIQAARQSLASVEVGINEIEQGIREANGQQQQFNNTVRGGGSAIDSMAGKIKSMVGAYVGIRSLGAGMQATDTYVSNNARLDLINDDLQTQAELQDKIYQAAQRSRGEYNAMVNTVAKLGLLAGDAFGSNDELIAFTELMNKSFKISGASTQESTNAMYQLTQAMASGRLQGDEYRSIIENAPMLANAIAEYCGVSRGELKQLASDGAISADVIKAAVFSTADEIESKYVTLPQTFSSVWTSIKNTAIQQFSGIMKKVNEFLNSDVGSKVVSGISSAIGTISMLLGGALDMIMLIATLFIDNWSWIEPIIWGVVAALIVYNATMGIGWLNTIKSAAALVAKTVADWAETAAILALTVAQQGLNAALAMCPITWIIVAVIILISVFYAVIGAINHFAGTSISATGVIVGAFFTACTFISNLFMGLLELVFGIIEYFYNTFIAFGNFLGNVFNDPIGAIINLFADLADNVLGVLEKIASAMDFVFGSNMASTVSGWRDGLKSMAENAVKEYGNGTYKDRVSELNIDEALASLGVNLERTSYSDAYDTGYWAGEQLDNKVSELLNPSFDTSNMGFDYGSMGQNLDNIAGDTGKMSDNLDTSEEDLKYLRDIAEQEAINRFTTAEIKVDMGGVNNTVNSNADLDGIADYLAVKVEEQMKIAAEGVHE